MDKTSRDGYLLEMLAVRSPAPLRGRHLSSRTQPPNRQNLYRKIRHLPAACRKSMGRKWRNLTACGTNLILRGHATKPLRLPCLAAVHNRRFDSPGSANPALMLLWTGVDKWAAATQGDHRPRCWRCWIPGKTMRCDHYIELPFDLLRVRVVLAARTSSDLGAVLAPAICWTIMEIITLTSYTRKLLIAEGAAQSR